MRQNNLFSHNGNPPLRYFTCFTRDVVGTNVRCWVEDVLASSVKGDAAGAHGVAAL